MRYITQNILSDLQDKMVFVSGPRQCGKTTMIKSLLPEESLYLNWDSNDHRKVILKKDWKQNNKIIYFDEIHKYSRWKNLVKGIYTLKKSAINLS